MNAFLGSPVLEMSVERELTEQDISTLRGAVQNGGLQPLENLTGVQRLHASHHSLAMLLAQGCTAEMASLLTNYSTQRIALLKKSPAFVELVAFYQKQDGDKLLDINAKLQSLGLDAVEVLHDRVREAPDLLKAEDLQKIIVLTMDRTGFGPQSTQKNSGGR